ncbi:MAG: 3-deoxy-7-phosphoheptulonate synthase [Sumerlaeia bacterium]
MTTQNLNVVKTVPLSSPQTIIDDMPASSKALETVVSARKQIKDILALRNRRLLAVVGPCSIHDEGAAYEYAEKLQQLAERVSDRICVIMRVYFEKPRTTVGWKGLINDPHLDGTFDIEAGLRLARKILCRINELGLPTGTEMLDPITPQYISDLVSWSSIGARTTESQTHRQMASGLSMPVGFKNATDGSIQIAIDAMISARSPHSFLGIDNEGRTSIIETRGNDGSHLILRGGRNRTNYDFDSIAEASNMLKASKLPTGLLVDCSHGNSEKDHNRQMGVWDYVVDQVAGGNTEVHGAMLESNLFPGNQKMISKDTLKYGVSITDACIGFDQTEELLLSAYEKMGPLLLQSN